MSVNTPQRASTAQVDIATFQNASALFQNTQVFQNSEQCFETTRAGVRAVLKHGAGVLKPNCSKTVTKTVASQNTATLFQSRRCFKTPDGVVKQEG